MPSKKKPARASASSPKVEARKFAAQAKQDEAAVVSALRTENARLRRASFVRQGQAEIIAEQIRELYGDSPAVILPTIRRSPRRAQNEVAMLHVSDTQIGKVTPTYDVEIAHGRLVELAERTVECIEAHRAYAAVETIHVYLGGDMVEGESIFPGQVYEIAEHVGAQAMKSAPAAMEAMILILAQHVAKVRVVCVSGNHGRSMPRSMGAHPGSNWDAVSYSVLRERLAKVKGDRIEFVQPDSWFCIDEILGWKNLLTHGDLIRGGFGGMPWYGVGKKASGWADALGEHWDNLYFGHFHTMTSGRQNTRAWYCNGTTESSNDYARAELAACGLPMQRLQFFNAKHGVVADRTIHLTYGLDKVKAKR